MAQTPAPPKPAPKDDDRGSRFVWKDGDVTITPPKSHPKPKGK